MRRPLLKTGAILATIVFAAGLASYLLLLTALPRKWILNSASARLGLNVMAQSLSVGWTGRTTIRNAKVTMPLSNQDILTVDEIELSHRALPWLLLTRSIGLDAIRIDGPSLRLHHDSRGRWNLQDAWARINAGRKPEDRLRRQTALPRIKVHNATIRITDANGATETIGPLDFEGQPQDHSAWTFSLQSRPQVEVTGQLAQGHDWTHVAGFSIRIRESLLQALYARGISPVEATGRWEGRLTNNKLAGRLELDRFRTGQLSLEGAVGVAAGPGGVTLRPDTLAISEPNVFAAPVRLTAGALYFGAEEIRAEQLGLRAGDVTALLDGQWDNTAHNGAVAASWTFARATEHAQAQGVCQITWRSPPVGYRKADIDLTGKVKVAGGIGSITARLRGEGETWEDSNWDLSVPEMVWEDDATRCDISGIGAGILCNWPDVQLTSLNLPNAQQVQANARFHGVTREWSAQVAVKGLHLERWEDKPIDIDFDGTGDRDNVVVSKFKATQGEQTVAAQGELVLADLSLQNAHVSAQWPVRMPNLAREASAREPETWHCEVDLTGRIHPTNLHVKGGLTGTNVPLGKQVIRQVDIPIQADVDAQRVTIASEPFTLLGGDWRISGRHAWSNTQTQLSLTLDNLSLKSAAALAGSPLACQGNARAELQLSAPGFRLQKAVAFGNWNAEAVKVASLSAETARGRIRIADGLVQFDEIRLKQGHGQAEGHLQFRLDRPQVLSVGFRTKAWPVELGDHVLAFRLDGTAEAELDVLAKTISGTGQLSGHVLWKDQGFGCMSLAALVRGRTLTVQEFQGEALGGIIEGTAQIPLNQWTNSTGQFQWHCIEPNALEPWWPSASRIHGRLSGSLTASLAANERRPFEPMRLELHAEMTDGRIGTAQVRDGHIVAYLGTRRLLIDRAHLELLGGQIDGRARVSRHIKKLYTNIVMDANDLDLNQLVHVINPATRQIAGRLTGTGNLLFSSDLNSFSGQADLALSQSDLVSNSVVRTLYNTLNLNLGSSEPKGAGRMKLQVDGVRMSISSFVYFNRGVEIRGAGQIDNFRLGSVSPINGYAFASTRVLKGIALPGVKELDRLMSSLQSGAAFVDISGTFNAPKVAVVPLPSLSDPLRRLLWAQLRSGQQQPER